MFLQTASINQSKNKMPWQYTIMLVLLLFYSAYAFDPPCCSQGEYLREVIVDNNTLMTCNNFSSINNKAAISCTPGNNPYPIPLGILSSDPIIKDKTLLLDISGEEFIADHGSYCFADLITDASDIKSAVPSAVLCGADVEPDGQMEVLAICMLVSTFFYLLTAVIYIFLPPLRDLLGICFINFCVAIGIGLLLFAILTLVPYTEEQFVHCAARGFFAYLFFIAAFFWTNAISIQTFRSIRTPASSDRDRKIFFWYAAYAWGIPVILTSIMVIVNYYPADHIKPGIGLNTCWFINDTQKWYYLFSIMTILILINVGLFGYVSYTLWRSTKWQSNYATDIRYRSYLTVKLFFIMGIPWIFEMIKSAFGNEHVLWFILDAMNALQGVVMFLVLVIFRKRAVRAMHARGWFLCLSDAVSKYLHKVDDEEAHVVAQTDFQDMTVFEK